MRGENLYIVAEVDDGMGGDKESGADKQTPEMRQVPPEGSRALGGRCTGALISPACEIMLLYGDS